MASWRHAALRSLRAAAAATTSTSQHGAGLWGTACCQGATLEQALTRRAGTAWLLQRRRGFAESAQEPDEVRTIGSPRLNQLVEEICQLNLLEVADLTELLQQRLGISGAAMAMPMGGGGAPGPAAGGGTAPAAAEAEPEKTEFDVKLEGFDAAAKIKVIKEVRVVTSLGLKEAKELVEKAPVVVKAGLKKEEAEELQKKLEAVGGKVVLE